MKYSLCFFSQAEMYRYNCEHPGLELNLEDTFLLLEVRDMIVRASEVDINSKPATSIRHIDTEDGVRYFNLEYDKLADDLFIANWKPRTVGDRMSKYVKGGLLKKITKPKGEGGIATFFAATTALNDLLYDKNNPEHRVDPRNNEDISVSAEEEASADEQEESRTTKKCHSEVPTEVKTAFGSESEAARTTKKSASEAVRTTKKSASEAVRTTKKSQSEKSKLYINPSTNRNPPTIPLSHDASAKNIEIVSDTKTEDSDGRTVFYSGLSNKFGFSPRFSPDPYYDIEKYFDALNLDYAYMRDYVSWLYDYLKDKCRKKEAFPGFFAIAAVKTWNLDKWYTQFQMQMTEKIRDAEAEAERQKEYITCPVCGARHDHNDSICPHCKTSADMLTNEQGLMIARDVWLLRQTDPARADAYYAEVTDASADMMSPDWMRLSAEDRMQAREEMNKAINEIHNKYFGAVAA